MVLFKAFTPLFDKLKNFYMDLIMKQQKLENEMMTENFRVTYIFHQVLIVEKSDQDVHEFLRTNLYMEWLTAFLHRHVREYQR
jgi:hypothetical protein